MAYPYSLVALLHCKWKTVPPLYQHNLLLRDTAIAWREARKYFKLSHFMSSHLPIQGNPSFPPGLEHKPFTVWQEKGLTKFSSLCDAATGRPLPYAIIAETFSLPLAHAFHYGQCISFLKRACKEDRKTFQPNITDQMLLDGSYKISNIYKPLLQKTTQPLTFSSVDNWRKDFPDPNLVDKIIQGLNTVQRLTPK